MPLSHHGWDLLAATPQLKEVNPVRHVYLLGKQRPQYAVMGPLCLGDTVLGEMVDEHLVGKGKPALLEDACIEKCPPGALC